ncbi:uncharacterized [Tachysurus ichikawai]
MNMYETLLIFEIQTLMLVFITDQAGEEKWRKWRKPISPATSQGNHKGPGEARRPSESLLQYQSNTSINQDNSPQALNSNLGTIHWDVVAEKKEEEGEKGERRKHPSTSELF